MKSIKATLLITALIISSSAKSQDIQSREDQLKNILDFSVAASFHDEVIRSIQIKCPEYKSKLPFNDAFIGKVKGINEDVAKLMDQITQGNKVVANAHATQIIANADGCKSESFKKSMEAIETHQAMLSLRAMQGRFK